MTDQATVLTQLAGADCSFCDGSVSPGEYQGNPAVVCAQCGTPALRLF
jgi:hypothetical protein